MKIKIKLWIIIINSNLKSILNLTKNYLETLYKDELDKIILFGSQARKDANLESDIDILIVLKKPFNYYQEIKKISQFISDLCLEYNQLVSCCFTTSKQWQTENSAFYRNIHQEGIVL